jgi:hypothetical protein
MTAIAHTPADARSEAARIAFAIIRFEEPMARPLGNTTPPGQLAIGTEAYVFTPSWRKVPRHDVEAFLVSLPGPALISQTTTRGMLALTLIGELSGDRRRWAEKTVANFTEAFDEMARQLRLTSASRILLEFDTESHVFSYEGVREWTQQFGVQVGWSMAPLEEDSRADARLVLRRSDGQWSDGGPQSGSPGTRPSRVT